jgi:hypothetical protein
MRKPRDHKADYRRRIERALKLGLSRSQGRGHPRSGEKYVSAGARPAVDGKLEKALRRLRRPGGTLSEAAKSESVSRERLSRYIKLVAGARRERRKWLFDDRRVRDLKMIAAEQFQPVKVRVRGFEPAHIAGLHAREAGQVLRDQGLADEFIRRWEGQRIRDVQGRWHTFSTDLNQIYAAFLMSDYSFEQFYRIET